MSRSTTQAPLTRGHKKRARTRRQLLQAAARVVADKGEAFTISDVVSHADVAAGTFYNYFEDKQDLVEALIEDLIVAFGERTARATRSSDGAVRVAVGTRRVLQAIQEEPLWGILVIRLGPLRPQIRTGALRYLRDDLQTGVEQGRFVHALSSALEDLVVGMLVAAAGRLATGEPEPGYETELIVFLLTGLGVDRDEAKALAEAPLDELEVQD